jgi:cobalt-zinc-cadmium efflux system protein
MTTVLVMPQGHADDALMEDITEHMHELFEITHVTIQVVKRPFTSPCGELPVGQSSAAPVLATPHGHAHEHAH